MSNREEVYARLEDNMLRYVDLASMPVAESGEAMVALRASASLLVTPSDPNMAAYTGQDIYVRERTASKLQDATTILGETDPSLQLQVVYGYRAKSIQTAKFEVQKAKLAGQYEGIDLLEAIHRRVAVPEVAGHPTGGAVDVQLARAGEPLDFGTKILDFVPDSYALSPFISEEAQLNRQLLRNCMRQAGFAPFDGEWWHFSFGDREWSKYYDQPNAIYDQIEFPSAQ